MEYTKYIILRKISNRETFLNTLLNTPNTPLFIINEVEKEIEILYKKLEDLNNN
jgi:hypothetical protein